MPAPSEALAAVLAVAGAPRNGGGPDRLLTEIADLARQRRDIDQRLRYLVAYAREFVYPRPYTLVDLAHAAGLSPSGIRVFYGTAEVSTIAAALGAADHADTRTAASTP